MGVPCSSSTIWGPLNTPGNLVFLKISKPEFQRFEISKCSEIFKILQKTRKNFLRIFITQIGLEKRFRTKNGICTHQVQPRTHMKACNFWGFLRLFPAADFVADFWPCAWCPHILIGVLGGQLLPRDPFQQQVGVPGSSSMIWGPLNIPENLVFSKYRNLNFNALKIRNVPKFVKYSRKLVKTFYEVSEHK